MVWCSTALSRILAEVLGIFGVSQLQASCKGYMNFPWIVQCSFLDCGMRAHCDVMFVFKPRNDDACVDGPSFVLYHILLWRFNQWKPEEIHVIYQQMWWMYCSFQLHNINHSGCQHGWNTLNCMNLQISKRCNSICGRSVLIFKRIIGFNV